jgi:putative membrane protein
MGDDGSMGGMAGWMASAMGIAAIVWLLVGLALLALSLAALVWLTLRLGRSSAAGGRGSGGLEELDRRYARGELDRDTYLKMRRDLVGR